MSELLDVLRLMDALKIAVFGLMETRVFGGDLSWGKYRWIAAATWRCGATPWARGPGRYLCLPWRCRSLVGHALFLLTSPLEVRR